MKHITLAAIVSALLASGCASAPSSRPAGCPETVGGYVAGQATSEFVKSCLGKPAHEDRNPDGRYVYLYNIDRSNTVAFLFDAQGKLIRTRGYQNTQ